MRSIAGKVKFDRFMLRLPSGPVYHPSIDAEGGINQFASAPAYELLANRLLPAIAASHTD
jgi:hypothetical protein